MSAIQWWAEVKEKFTGDYGLKMNDDDFIVWAHYWRDGLTPDEAIEEEKADRL